ncbi:MAG: hypothetical protein M1133_06820 [Armatimonadetes bacterium]|nr:hypothetical protein [Armatimonadota bacterium]
MYHRLLRITLILLCTLAARPWVMAAESTLKELTDGKVTVSYHAGMEAQAKHILEIAKQSIEPSLDINQRIVDLLSNVDSISKDIANLLGYEEKQAEAKARLTAYKQKSEALIQCFSHIRLIKKADAVATGGVDAGILQVRYSEDKDEFNMTVNLEEVDSSKVSRTYFPVFVNADGTVRAEKKLGEMAVDFLGSSKAMIIAPVHDTVGYIMTQGLNLYHPFSRWFNEGVSGWITRQVVTKVDPKLARLANDLFAVGGPSKALREKVNLLAWPQPSFQNRRSDDFDPAIESAQTQYSIEAISNLLGKNGLRDLPKIMREVDFNPNADTDTICVAIKKVTGKDFKTTLMGYVPQAIRDGIQSGEPKKLVARAEGLVQEKKWADAVSKLKLALRMTPDDANMRLNLAWLEREVGDRLDSEIQVFLAARLLKQGNHSFHLLGESLEGNYVLGRFAIMMGNLEYAKKFLQPVLEAKPDHADAKRAMEEIAKLEAAAGSRGN